MCLCLFLFFSFFLKFNSTLDTFYVVCILLGFLFFLDGGIWSIYLICWDVGGGFSHIVHAGCHFCLFICLFVYLILKCYFRFISFLFPDQKCI